MDGALVESEDIWREVREEFAASVGRAWTAADQASSMGCNTAAWARIMVERLDLRTRLAMDEPGPASALCSGHVGESDATSPSPKRKVIESRPLIGRRTFRFAFD